MAALRKRWATQLVGGTAMRRHESKAEAYRYARNDAANYDAGAYRDIDTVKVWVDERDGNGWQLYESVSLADLPATNEDGA